MNAKTKNPASRGKPTKQVPNVLHAAVPTLPTKVTGMTALSTSSSSEDSRGGTTPKISTLSFFLMSEPSTCKNLYSSLEVFIKALRRPNIVQREPLEHYVSEQLVQISTEICYTIEDASLSMSDIKEMTENLVKMHDRISKLSQEVAVKFAHQIIQFVRIISPTVEKLEIASNYLANDWLGMAEFILARTNLRPLKKIELHECIPKLTDIKDVRLLGSGGFGTVSKGLYKPADVTVSIKIVPLEKLPYIELAAADKVVASIINSFFLVSYLCVFRTTQAYVTLMEYVAGVDISRVLGCSVFIPSTSVKLISAQTFLAIEHLHLKGFIHRDIKTSNILIRPSGHIKVIDFDTNKLCLSHFLKDRPMVSFFKRTAMEFRDAEVAGTLNYMAPELHQSFPYGRAVDWWSLGVTMYRLFMGQMPFPGDTDDVIKQRVLNDRLNWSSACHYQPLNVEFMEMVTGLLKKFPGKRLGSHAYSEIREHKYFCDVDLLALRGLPEVCEVPDILKAMNPCGPVNGKYSWSPMPSATSLKRAGLRLDQLTECPREEHVPLLTFTSHGFRQMIHNIRHTAFKKEILGVNDKKLYGLGTLSSELNYTSRVDRRTAIIDWDLMEEALQQPRFRRMRVTKEKSTKLFRGSVYGFTLSQVPGPSTLMFATINSVTAVTSSSFGIIEGDIVLKIDQLNTCVVSLDDISRYLSKHDTVELEVFNLNPLRLMRYGHDLFECYRYVAYKNILIPTYVPSLLGRSPSFNVIGIQMTNCRGKRVPLFVVSSVCRYVKIIPFGVSLYVGDIITKVNGISTSCLHTTEEFELAFKSGKTASLTLTFLPVSPLRSLEL